MVIKYNLHYVFMSKKKMAEYFKIGHILAGIYSR